MGPVVSIELERIEALELLGMTLAHLNDAEARVEVSPRVPLLMAIRDKLALALREESGATPMLRCRRRSQPWTSTEAARRVRSAQRWLS
jgi:hypothetical protein